MSEDSFMGMEFVEFKDLEELASNEGGQPLPIEVAPEMLGEFPEEGYEDNAFSKPSVPDAVLIVQDNEVVDIVEVSNGSDASGQD